MSEVLMPIGRFSKSCRLTVKALRHYDDIGLLKPAFVEPQTGYRYYTQHQAKKAVLISMLRSLDIAIPTIEQLLVADDREFGALLEVEQARILKEMSRQQQILQSIKRMSQKGELIPYEIAIRTEPSYMVAQLSCRSALDRLVEDGSRLIYQLYDILQHEGRGFEDPVMCINRDPDKKGEVIIDACIGVKKPYPQTHSASIVDIPGGTVAWLTHKGSYSELGLAYNSLFAWSQEFGYQQRDAMREIYKNDPSEVSEDELITEVILPIE
ncbi:MerR family transcriptional regulator [Sessilibacter corallicola]|uniref:MerR family transcriptional regulator n=1 Tax=Sessilibacter corallicola TaxID=2904075 RepID=A0ABQ0AF70_9GAMM